MTGEAAEGDLRRRILAAASQLLKDSGMTALTTRAIAKAAGVQVPAIYRLFGDKDKLLDAIAEHHLEMFFAEKGASTEPNEDPLLAFRRSWDAQIQFGLANPEVFSLLSDPTRAAGESAREVGTRALTKRVRYLAQSGYLRVPEQRAIGLILAAGTGVVTTLLSATPELRDTGLATAALDGLLQQILVDQAPPAEDSPLPALIALRASIPRLTDLTPTERALLHDWIDRVIAGGVNLAPPDGK